MNHLSQIIEQFAFNGQPIDAAPWGGGHINDTYLVRLRIASKGEGRSILQRINTNVFRMPVELMQNVELVTAHLREKIIAAVGDPLRETLNLIPTRGGASYYRDSAGGYWRAYHFIEGAHTVEKAESAEQVYHAGYAFGHFQKLLADLPASRLHETIPHFHDTPHRYAFFAEIARRDPAGRAAGVRDEIEFVQRRAADTRVLAEGIAQGRLPLRVTHNDTKISNVMIDDATGRSICLVDLDTVMPGLALYDFGDAVRSAAARFAEDAPDCAGSNFSLEVFDQLARGYLEAVRGFLTPAEVDLLAFSARLITLEQTIRFLGDYLNGDTYYKVAYPTHNLVRARTQMQMLRDMEDQFDQMTAIIEAYRQEGTR